MDKKSKIFYLAVLPALFIQALSSVLYFVLLQDGFWASLAYFMVKFVMLLWPIFIVLWIFKNEFPKFTEKKNHKLSLLLGFAAGLFVVLLAVLLYHLFLKEVLLANLPAIQAKIEMLGLGAYFIPFAIILSTFNAAFEEYYWRWFTFRALTLKLAWPIAAVISAIGFSAHHFVVLTEFFAWPMVVLLGTMVFLGGLIMAVIYKKTNSIWGAVLFHFLIDMTVMGLVYILL